MLAMCWLERDGSAIVVLCFMLYDETYIRSHPSHAPIVSFLSVERVKENRWPSNLHEHRNQ